MTTAGIICELNPFHRGHERIIRAARRAGADRVILVMSGDYVQRGLPAVFPRHLRAASALRGGADAVLALPSRWATASAESFAGGAVGILDSLGAVDLLVFGSESGDGERIEACASVLAEEPASYRTALREHLRTGLSFPRARAAALPKYAELLGSPNDILAVEYVKALIRRHSSVRPVAVKREGENYLSDRYEGTLLSAASVRRAIREGRADVTERAVPAEVLPAMRKELDAAGWAGPDEFSLLLADRLLSAESPEDLLAFEDVTEPLAGTFFRERNRFVSFTSFAERCASRSVTLTHVNRALLHITLGIRRLDGGEEPLWTQLLGFRDEAGELVGRLRDSCRIPLVVNPPRERKRLPEPVAGLFDEEMRVCDLYRRARAQRGGAAGGPEMAEPLIKV